MTVTHVGTSIDGAGLNDSNPRQTITLAKPGGTQEGDFLLFLTVLNGDSDFLTPPSGVELIHNISQTTHSHMWGKIATGSEPSSYTFEDEISTDYLQGVLIVWSGVADLGSNFPLLHQGSSNSSSSTNLTTPTINVTSAPARLIHFRQTRRSSSSPGTLSTSAPDVTEHVNRAAGTGSTSYRFAVWSEDNLRTTTGNKTGITISASSSQTHNILRTIAILGIEAQDFTTSTVIDLAASISGSSSKQFPSNSVIGVEIDAVTTAAKGIERTIDLSIDLASVAESLKIGQPSGNLDLEFDFDAVVTDLFEGNFVNLDVDLSIIATAQKELNAIRVTVGEAVSSSQFLTVGAFPVKVGGLATIGDLVAGSSEKTEVVAGSATRILVGGMGV